MPEILADSLRLRKPLCDDVPRSGKSLLDRGDLLSDIFPRLRLRIGHLDLPHPVRQRLKTLFLRHRGAGSPLRPVWQVKILQLAGHHAILYPAPQLVRQLSLLGDRGKDAILPLLHVRKDIIPVLDLRHSHVVKTSGLLLSVTADERDGVSFLEKLHAVLHLPILHGKGARDVVYVDILHIHKVLLINQLSQAGNCLP